MNNKTRNLKININETEKELETFKKINNEIAEIKKNIQILITKTGIMEGLEIKRREPFEILEAMTEIVVENRMWFTSFKVIERTQARSETKKEQHKKSAKSKEIPEEKPTREVDLIIKGYALDSKTVADFMTLLESSPSFINVNLKTIKQANIKDLNVMEFEINLNKMAA